MVSATIIGGNYAGLIAARKLIKSGVDVTIISPSDHFYLNPSAPRLLVQPELIDEVIRPISEAFEKMTYTHIKGSVTQLSPAEKSLTIESADGSTVQHSYEYLIIASGTKSKSVFWKNAALPEEIKSLLVQASEKLAKAKSVAIVGGGATGVETAGEIGTDFPKVKVDLYTKDTRVLPKLPAKKSRQAQNSLGKLGINIISNASVSEKTDTTITVKDETKTYDLVFDTTGLFPNSEFIPQELLDKNGYLITNEYLQVELDKSIFALGDIVSKSENTIVDILFYQIPVFMTVIKKIILGKDATLKKYNPDHAVTTIIPIGRNGGVGVIFGWSLPTFFVKRIKSKDFMISKAKGYFDEH